MWCNLNFKAACLKCFGFLPCDKLRTFARCGRRKPTCYCEPLFLRYYHYKLNTNGKKNTSVWLLSCYEMNLWQDLKHTWPRGCLKCTVWIEIMAYICALVPEPPGNVRSCIFPLVSQCMCSHSRGDAGDATPPVSFSVIISSPPKWEQNWFGPTWSSWYVVRICLLIGPRHMSFRLRIIKVPSGGKHIMLLSRWWVRKWIPSLRSLPTLFPKVERQDGCWSVENKRETMETKRSIYLRFHMCST